MTEIGWEDLKADPNASYTSLISFQGYGIEVGSIDLINSTADFRLSIAGTPTNGIRLKLASDGTSIKYRKVTVGSLSSASLCSGDYRSICRLIVSKEKKSLHLVFK